ncbi:MAG: leucyl aminopeptidase, partial [Mastigocladus sp. ERB_26_1]
MEIIPSSTPILEWTGDGLAVGLFEDNTELTGELATLDEKFAGYIKELIAEEEFK